MGDDTDPVSAASGPDSGLRAVKWEKERVNKTYLSIQTTVLQQKAYMISKK